MSTTQDGLSSRLPDPGAGFVWDTSARAAFGEQLLVLRPQTERARAVFTTRLGGLLPPPWDTLNVSFAVADGAEPCYFDDMVICNREIAALAIRGSGDWSVVRQVHGDEVVRARRGKHRRAADALWTDDPSRTIAVMAADCVPVLLVDDGRVGAAHAGWRGLMAGIIENAAKAVRAREVFAGPAIGPCCFEVGDDVAHAFEERFGPAVLSADRCHVDLWSAVETAARCAGVREVRTARVCTSCHTKLFFSHRRDRGRTGRQALVARLP